MNYIILPHSNNIQIPVDKFIATWKVWVETFYPRANYETLSLPRRNAAQSYQQSIAQGLAPCLDIICRLLAPPSKLNTMQATNNFMKVNMDWLGSCKAIAPSGREVNGAKLNEKSIRFYSNLKSETRQLLEQNARYLTKNI
jgi:hypothetical protein